MARYTGPKVKISRRLGVNIFENDKGSKALNKRPYPPGEHGRSRRRQPSEYLLQLQEKQKAKYIYGVLERQFSNLYKEASRQKGVTGENLLRMLEQRLDNIVFRAGWASTRPQARQFVSHGMVNVNGKRVDIPSYAVKVGQKLDLTPGAQKFKFVAASIAASEKRNPASWMDVDKGTFSLSIKSAPPREDLNEPEIREQLVVEYYSR